ncbi:MAG: ABC transporter ATP-binding protein, partial [Muribaculaceae bacterium]|nr:ABC transporter ATP-binding protein [Muribaculaceae bacterium]
MLTIKDLSFGYNSKMPIISDLSMTVDGGTVCGLLGRNGAGKSTLLYLICGLLKPSKGTIDYNGRTPFDRSVPFLQDVFMVPEEFGLPSVSLDDYIKVNEPFYPKFDRDLMNRCLDIFELSPNLNLGELSLGQKKKVYISFAMACNTSLVVLDEPTNGLDISAKRNFRKVVVESMNDDKCIIISTHQVYDVDK